MVLLNSLQKNRPAARLQVHRLSWLLLCALPFSSNGQDRNGGTGDLKSFEIEVVESYKAQVRAAQKISEQPSFSDSTSQKLPVDVRINPKGLIIDYSPATIDAVELERVRLPKLPSSRFTVGGGNYAGSLLQLALSAPRSSRQAWGLNAYHNGGQSGVRSSATVLDRQPHYDNGIKGHFQIAAKDYSLTTQLAAQANYRTFYGTLDTLLAGLDTLPATWNTKLALNQSWVYTGRNKSRSKAAYRSGSLFLDLGALGLGSREQRVGTRHQIQLEAGKGTPVLLDLGYQLGRYDAGSAQLGSTLALGDSSTNYHHFFFEPRTSGKKGIVSYSFGVNFAATAAALDSSAFQFYIFPDVVLQAELLKHTLAIYGGWTGRAEQQSLNALHLQNAWISAPDALYLSGENKGYVGMQGALVGAVQYRVEASLNFYNNAVQFLRDSVQSLEQLGNRNLALLQVGYTNYRRSAVRAELNIPLEHFSASTYLELSTYHGENDFIGQEARLFGGRLRYDWQSLTATTDLKYVGGRMKGDAFRGEHWLGNYQLEDYLDWNLEVRYGINENLDASLRASNLLNQSYQLWSGYTVRGTRALFAINYQF